MAVRNIATSDTLETFRTEFNAEAINFGDIATLNAGLTATTIVGSVNEIYTTAIVGKNQGTNFTNSLLVGHTTTGTLNAAQWNTGVGIASLDALTSGDYNAALGYGSLSGVSSGVRNIGIGAYAGTAITTGQYIVAVGLASLFTVTTTNANTTVGYHTGNKTTGANISFLGYRSGVENLGGTWNTFVGHSSGVTNTTGDGNVIIGHVNAASATGDRQLKIAGYDGTTTTTWISGDSAGDVTFANDITVTGSINGTFSGTVGANTVTNTSIANNAVTQAKIADDAVGYDELENIQTLILYASAPTTATANCNGAISSSTALVVDGNSGTIAVGMIVSGTGVETTNPPSVITVTDQNNLV